MCNDSVRGGHNTREVTAKIDGKINIKFLAPLFPLVIADIKFFAVVAIMINIYN